ncbi:hypothetical protein OG992_18645 [Micromonospora sp. NBC_00362]|uniref:hypothetical protein n=1 Tax=Micromonospora sp. NBC_00362 TaxID=2975975 RepID=UPI0022520902|nr:hypothetical protein [Micromonospora sp. NBC_00362]MCX5119208.1 hypothetical protein [Micromonospora sp. NBC_00362]
MHAAFGANPAGSPGSWTWTDLSSRLQPEPVRLRAGRSAGASNSSPGTCTVTLDNDDGALTPLHPLSTFWPNVRRGTPLRVRVFWGGVWVVRFAGFADQWEPEFLPTTTPGQASSRVRVTASGLLRRLEQGNRTLFSAPRRYIPRTNPVAYWPLEDGQLASEGAALAGAQSMRPFVGTHPSGAVISYPRWGQGDLAPWLPSTVSRSGNAGLTVIWAPVTMASSPTRWTVDTMYRSGTDAGDGTIDVNPSYLPGGALAWPQLLLLPSVRGLDVAMNGEPEVSATAATLFDGLPHHVRWDVTQSGAKVAWVVYVDGVSVNSGTTSGNMALPSMSSLALTASAQDGADLAQGHVAVWTSPPTLSTAVAAAFGYRGETAAVRVTRLCAEESITVTVGSGGSEPMGPQAPATLVELLREAEDADMGVLYESGFGLAYRPRGARYNAPVGMTVDLAQYLVARNGSRDVLSPAYDDQGLRNEWTVTRPDGGEATVSDLGHQARVGIYADSADLNVASDGRLVDHAAWRVWLGTVDELRERAFPLDLAANPGLLTAWLACQVGTRVVRTNPPAQYQPGDLDRLVDGWSETIGPRSWMVQVTPSPAAVWDVATADGEQRVAADGSTLAMDLTSSATLFALSHTAANGPWTWYPVDYPLDVRIGGEKVRADAAGWVINGNPWFVTDVSGWVGASSGVTWLASGRPGTPYGVARITPDGVAAVGGLHSAQVAVTASTTYRLTMWAYAEVAPVDVNIAVDWLTGAGVPISSSFGPTVSLTPGVWTPFTVAFSSPATTGLAVLRARHGGTPAASSLWRVSGYTIATEATTTGSGAFQRLSCAPGGRGINGINRAWPSGTEVDVWQPAISAL